MNLLATLPGSLMEGFLPAGWNLQKIDACVGDDPRTLEDRQQWWHRGFRPIACDSLADFDTFMGHEIALTIRRARDAGEKLVMILPVGPMGMYRWTVFFLKEWNVPCDHVYGFNMDEWSDAQGNTLPPDNTGSFRYAMEQAFYGPLGKLTVPEKQRHFATKDVIGTYGDRIGELKAAGAKHCVIFGIGRVCHIAFWEPQFAAEYAQRRRMEGPDASSRREAAPADDRAERDHELQEPHDPRSSLRQHDRTEAVPERRPHHRRCRRHAVAGNDVARTQLVDDLPPRADAMDPFDVDAHSTW